MEFRIVFVVNLPNSLFNKETKMFSQWFDGNKYTVKRMTKYAKTNNRCLKKNIIKDWWLEYKR